MPDIPKLTDSQAAILRTCLQQSDGYCRDLELLKRSCLLFDGRWTLTTLGRAALEAYDAARRRAIRVEAMQECAKAVYFDMDAFDAVCELIAKEGA